MRHSRSPEVRPSHAPHRRSVALRLALLIGVAGAGPLSPFVSAQVATNNIYACQANAIYDPVPLLENDHSGASFGLTGDWNGDGFTDVIIGSMPSPTKNPPPGQGPVPSLSRALLYLGSASGPSITPVLKINGNGWRDQFGKRVAFLPDITGDGCDELLVAAPEWPNQDTRTGRVYIFFGQPEIVGPIDTVYADEYADIIIKGDVPGSRFGDSLATTQLLEPGSATQFVVGAPGSNVTDSVVGVTYAGRAYEFFGNPSSPIMVAVAGIGGIPAWPTPFLIDADDAANVILEPTMAGSPTADRFGYSLAIIGDINGDGYEEFAVGAPQVKVDGDAPRGLTGPGYVRIYDYQSSSTSYVDELNGTQGAGDPPDPPDPTVGEAFGWALAAVDIGGDPVTGDPDGFNDLCVGSILWDRNFNQPHFQKDVGAVRVFSGADLDSQLLVDGNGNPFLVGEDDNYYFGASITGVANFLGTVNPPVPELAIGSFRYGIKDPLVPPFEPVVDCSPVPSDGSGPYLDQNGSVAGAVYVVDGATTTGTPAFRIIGERFKDSLGWDVAAGDLDGDGKDEILTGGFRWSDPLYEAPNCDPMVEYCPTETGRAYQFETEKLPFQPLQP